MEIKPTVGGVSARFMCSCGHLSPGMLYGGESFAISDREAQESKPCLACDLKMTPQELESRIQRDQSNDHGRYTLRTRSGV
ncbi:hypothetical protein ABIC83_002760 [Roseateles asaccharophilus]|uniref:hypothetical protein n=1 Tax=Roseateles asaccharophilus TaxID=582607 RepID=UPI003833FA2F